MKKKHDIFLLRMFTLQYLSKYFPEYYTTTLLKSLYNTRPIDKIQKRLEKHNNNNIIKKLNQLKSYRYYTIIVIDRARPLSNGHK